jgi:Ca2+-transporting ATPase
MQWHQYTKKQLESELETNEASGLSLQEAAERLKKFGPNLLAEKSLDSWMVVFFRQFKSPLVYVLLVCSVIVYFMGQSADSSIIVVVLIFNAIIGAIQEGRSQGALRSLKRLSRAEAMVIRDGKETMVGEADIVLGDVLILQEGQKIVADSRVVVCSGLSVDESSMTGESGGISKSEGVLEDPETEVASRHNMVFKGTAVLSGHARCIVVATGMNTEIGRISRALLQPETETPMQKNIGRLSQVIIAVIIVISVILFVGGISTGKSVKEMFTVVVSLAVSVIPEGLPLVLTVILVSGVWRMGKRNALVKKLQAVEVLGQANIIAVDKTGTITKNEMAAVRLYVSGRMYEVGGSGYEPSGLVTWRGQPQELEYPDLQEVAIVAGLSSKASVIYLEEEQVFKVFGDPTEAAMTVLAEKLGFVKDNEKYREIGEITFDHKNKFHACFYEKDGSRIAVVAGAPEVMLQKSEYYWSSGEKKKITPAMLSNFESAVEEFSKLGLRVVAFGNKDIPASHGLEKIDDIVLVGLVAIEDAIRPEAAGAIAKAKAAGLGFVLITGDHKNTARAIAEKVGIWHEKSLVITARELHDMPSEELSRQLPFISVFARVTPEDKMDIIKAYKNSGLVVAMTGDGVNDAPSLVAADLGVAMGKIGTEVAKEAADIVLLDDNLSSIVAAIEEGRIMYRNIQKVLLFLFSTSLGELLTIIFALLLHYPLPVLAVQILWLNLITDPLIGLALALDGNEKNLMDKKFSSPPTYFITPFMVAMMVIVGLVMAGGTLLVFSYYFPFDYFKGITISLTMLAVFQWYNGFNSHALDRSVFQASPPGMYLWVAVLANAILQVLAVHNHWLQKILGTAALSVWEWLMIVVVCLSIIVLLELCKWVWHLFSPER